MQIHVVSSGQSVYSIAHAYGVSPQQIITDNGLSDPDRLVIGQALVIQQPIITHTVQPGETLFQIAKMYRLSTNELYRNNLQLKGQPMLYPGQTLIISQKAKNSGKSRPTAMLILLLTKVCCVSSFPIFHGSPPFHTVLPARESWLRSTTKPCWKSLQIIATLLC